MKPTKPTTENEPMSKGWILHILVIMLISSVWCLIYNVGKMYGRCNL